MGLSPTAFRSRLEREVLGHPVIRANAYTAWFSHGEFNIKQARAFLVQFSVFSNQFLVAQLQKVLNAETLEEMRASKEILANEIGVGFRRTGGADDDVLGSTLGSVEGGTFHFSAAHFELLARMARQLGLDFADLGKRRFGTGTTLHFCDELQRLYAHEDYQVAAAASWAIENWAAAGFWDELVEGWQRFGKRVGRQVFDIGFFTWHARIEANHAQHTQGELEELLADHYIDEERFIKNANLMLDAVLVFWRGLDFQRAALTAEEPINAKAG
jgi:pyrroloquinoline quinone (PQQ) biosynthesis protein C